MKRAILTGATGAIGMALLNELIRNNVEVLIFCRENSDRNCNIPVHPLVTIKYYSLERLEQIQNDTNKEYDVFYHFAWAGTIGDSRNNVYLQQCNIKYTIDAVVAAERFGCKMFIGAGSQAEYGRVEGALDTTVPTCPENGYGMAKLCAGQMSRLLCGQKGIKHIWTRILSVYGPYDNPNTMVMTVIGNLLRGEVPALTKGEQKWDYLYSKDAAKAFRLLAEYGVDGKTYCIGSGNALPLLDYMEQLRDAIDEKAYLGIGQMPYSEKQIMYLCADISELAKDTGFAPRYSFKEGIADTVRWYKKYYLKKKDMSLEM